MVSLADEGGGVSDTPNGGTRVFIGSFNINSQDLSSDAARAWLKEAEGADIVALGLQECATVPANPFPEPANGKAVAMWKQIKDLAVPEAGDSATDNATQHGVDNGGGDGDRRSSSAMAGIAQAAMAAASAAARKNKKPRPHGSVADSVHPACEKSDGGSAGGDRVPREDRESSYSSGDLESSKPLRLGETQGRSGDGNGSSNKGMRQESYYLRGAIEEGRDKDLLATIADCIPGRTLIADVAMGETPTHGKIKVNISKNYPKTPSLSREASASSYSAAAAVEAACKEASGSTSEGLGLDSVAGDGPLDASGRPGWSVGDSGEGGVSASVGSSGKDDAVADAESAGAVFKTVEWYGTIRLLVFVRKDLYKNLSVRTVVIPAGDKPSVVADAPEDYAKDTSPDKGAVACYLEDSSSQSPLELLLVNCHLYGTNKYGVKEAVFDKYRLAQLRAIDSALHATLPTAAAAPLVLLGDLNFRVEMLSEQEDKAKGGNDFQEVRKLAETCDAEILLSLYGRADRLRRLLEGGQREVRDSPLMAADKLDQPAIGRETTPEVEEGRIPSLLEGLNDGLKASLLKGQAIRPTFTYKPGDTSSTPRRFNDKRTPSWTDRILWRGFADDKRYHPHQDQEGSPAETLQKHTNSNSTFASVQEVISSDHEPVYCTLDLPRPKPAA
eukprot:g16387.t1